MPPILKKTLISLGKGASALSIAGALVFYFESGNKLITVPYKDVVGVWTVCNGITGKDVVPGKKYTEKECKSLEEKHLKIAEDAVKRHILPYSVLNNWTKAALISFTYNLGEGNLSSSTLKRKFNAGDVKGGCEELKRWVYAGGVMYNGLIIRRGAEKEICTGELYESSID